MLEKSKSIMRRPNYTFTGMSKSDVLFVSEGDEETAKEYNARRQQHVMPRAMWVDMGSPEVVTVTIEPGDKLNDIHGSPFTAPEMEDLK